MSAMKPGILSSPAAQLMAIEVITELLVSASPQKLGEVLTEHLRELSGARTVMVLAHRKRPDRDSLLHVSPLRRFDLFAPAELDLFCLEHTPGELPYSPDELPADLPLKVVLERAGIHSLARFPLRAAGELIGMLLLFDLPGIDRITETNQIIHLLSSPIALALKNALAFRQIAQQAVELEKRVEERTAELGTAQMLFRAAIYNSPIPIMIHDEDNRVLQLSLGWTTLSGYTLEDIPTLADWTERAYGERTGSIKAYIDNLFEINQTVDNGEWTITTKNGSKRIWHFQATPLGKVGNGKRVLLSMAVDVTEQKRNEESLRKSEERHRTILRTAMDGIWLVDLQGRFLEVNDTYCGMSGYSMQELLALKIHDVEVIETIEDTATHVRKIIEQGNDRFESRHRRKDGSEYDVEVSAQFRSVEGGQILSFIQDISARKRSEAEKAKLEGQLRQAQKMESIGRLAGGVAHDFNNMLGVILGHTEIGLLKLDPSHHLFARLVEIRKAAERSADLTRQLLAFARKQTVTPKVVDLNETVGEMLQMLQRLIGEDISLTFQPGSDLWPVMMDPSQVDQILANLCVNARDAIEDTGRIAIVTENCSVDAACCAHNPDAEPREYVRLVVSDDGCGMDKETQSHIFEPFYTTKEMGKGTGLGLATVYGAVRQNNGFINIYSEPGQGSTFSVYLPRHAVKIHEMQPDVATPPVQRGHETILLVEDEPAILEITSMMLGEQGYTVLAATTPGEAIQFAREHVGEINLLMTDVIMPEMNGRDLAKNLLTLYPRMKRLFMSGYTADIIAHHGVLDEGAHFIQKPFSLASMTDKVRLVLDSP